MSNTTKDAKIQEKFEYSKTTPTNQLPVQIYCYNQGQYIKLKDWPYTDMPAYPDQTMPVPQQLVKCDPRPVDRLDVAWMARKKGIIAAESFDNEACLLCIEYKRLGAMDLDDWSPAFTANNPEHGPFAPIKRNAVNICRQVCDYMKTRRSRRALIFDYRAMVLLAYPGETIDSVHTMNFTWIREVEGPQTTGNAASFRAMVLVYLVAAIYENKLDTGSAILPRGH